MTNEESPDGEPTEEMALDDAFEIAESVSEDRLRKALLAIRKSETDQSDTAFFAASQLPEYATNLKAVALDYLTTHEFSVGDLVTWKPHLKNRLRPAAGTAAVVVEILDEPVMVDPTPVDATYAERLDLRLGMLIEPDNFVVYHFDSRRFMPFSGAESSPAEP